MSSLETVWNQREDDVYCQLFGPVTRGIFALPVEIFSEVFGQTEVDPRWLFHGVFEFAPTPERSSWLYVTSGTSNPWTQDPSAYDRNAFSGAGTELVLETVAQGDWAVACMQRLLSYNILLRHERLGCAGPLDHGARVPLGGAIDGSADSSLQFVVIAEPENFPSTFQLDSGRVDLLQVVGISSAEREFAKDRGFESLVAHLRHHGAFPMTDPGRESTV